MILLKEVDIPSEVVAIQYSIVPDLEFLIYDLSTIANMGVIQVIHSHLIDQGDGLRLL